MREASVAGSSTLVRVGVAVFAMGLAAVAVIFVMFAAGVHDLPLWLNLAAMLAPAGFGLALLGLFRQARRSRAGATGPSPARGGSS